MHTDIPLRSEIEQLAAVERPNLITIVLRTSPVTTDAEANRISFGNLVSEAVAEHTAHGGDAAEIAATEAGLRALLEDTQLWRYLSHSLVVFASPERTVAYRLPNELESEWFSGNHFRVVPLLRTITFAHDATVLALSQKDVRLIVIGPDHRGSELPVPELPSDLLDTFNVEDPGVDSHRRRLHGPEGHDARLLGYARAVDRAIAPVLRSTRGPLILAAAQPLDSVFRSVTRNAKLLDAGISGNPDNLSSTEIDTAAREILDAYYADELAERQEKFGNLQSAGRAVIDLTDISRAAVAGAISTLYVDMDAHPEGTLDDQVGGLVADSTPGYSLVDQLASKVLASGGRVLALRGSEVPGGAQLAAEVRFSV
ncbi:hypothetical protein ACF07D_13105 [Leucobacter sp. NPDC015123]|uniref:baeRF11 domain-containing protein n=1 Tax=Leucobacter sp. NPDC015123 TaxID=3364129 RepID=UPI000E658424